MVLGSGQPVVIFHQHPYATAPQIDPMRTGNTAGTSEELLVKDKHYSFIHFISQNTSYIKST